MPTLRLSPTLLLSGLVLLVFLARPSHAFGAGNIASTAQIEGQNWRHGDIEDTLLTLLMSRASGKKFSKMDVKRVYFGNWLRDYSQAVDVGSLKMVSAEAVRLLLWILGFMSFGYGTGEFEVTRERLGCYRPEEHIDNPKDYADNMDARQYDDRLRGPVDERVELAIDERTGLKNYIANERAGIETSAGLVRRLFGRSIELARRYNRDKNKADLYEALRLLGTGCHCLEDYSAHSNFTELALIELGERDVFPHVGRNTKIQIEGVDREVYPIITGTFGGVDFLHSVMGEFNDKATQSEIQELEGTISDAERNHEAKSMVKDLLSKLPDGIFGGKDEAGKADELEANATAAQMENMTINPKEPEAFVEQAEQIRRQIYPVLEFHDEIMHSISDAIDKIPIIPDLIEEFQNQINIFVFSLIAPFVLPLIQQVKSELETGSSEVIQSSVDKQHIVFSDDDCSDPTHSMLSKDHFSNVLNEPAGKIASQVLKWVVPQIVECWDDENIDVERTINRIITGVFHHPAQRELGQDGASDGRQQMFRVVQQWWEEQSDRQRDDLRDKLSRDGVENGRNHKEGVHDSGHGCGKPLSVAKIGGGSGGGSSGGGSGIGGKIGQGVSEAVGGGALGGLLGGIVGNALGNTFDKSEKESQESSGYGGNGSYNQSYSEVGRSDDGSRHGQAEYRRSDYPEGRGHREEVSRYESQGSSSYGFQASSEERYSSGGYERRQEERYESSSGDYETRRRTEGLGESGEYYSSESRHHGRRDEEEVDSDEEKRRKKERKRREKEEKRRRKEERGEEYSGGEDSEDSRERRRHSGEHRRRSGEYGGGRSSEYSSGGYGGGERSEYSGRSEGYGGSSGYAGGRSEYSGGGGGYGGGSSEYSSGGGGGYGASSGGYGGSGGYGERPPPPGEYGGGGGGFGGVPGGYRGEEDEYGRPPRRDFDEGPPRRDFDEGPPRRGYGEGGYGGGGYGGGY